MTTLNEKFVELAQKRTTNVINSVRILSNLSARSRYDYTDEQIDEIFNAIEKAVSEARQKFSHAGKPEPFQFKNLTPAEQPKQGYEVGKAGKEALRETPKQPVTAEHGTAPAQTQPTTPPKETPSPKPPAANGQDHLEKHMPAGEAKKLEATA